MNTFWPLTVNAIIFESWKRFHEKKAQKPKACAIVSKKVIFSLTISLKIFWHCKLALNLFISLLGRDVLGFCVFNDLTMRPFYRKILISWMLSWICCDQADFYTRRDRTGIWWYIGIPIFVQTIMNIT